MGCVRRVRATLEDQPGVDNVAIDFDSGEAMFTAGSEFDFEATKAALAENNYGAALKG